MGNSDHLLRSLLCYVTFVIVLLSYWQVLAHYFEQYRQPWLNDDIQSLLRRQEVEAVKQVPFVALHVRRTDKLRNEAHKVQIEVIERT